MLDYIIQDFIKSRIRFGDHTIGEWWFVIVQIRQENYLKFLSANIIQTKKQLKKYHLYSKVAEPAAEYG